MENSENEYIIVGKKLSYKLIEKGYFDSLIKVNGNDYLFENLPEIQDIVDLYGVHMNVINDSLCEALEPMEATVEAVSEVIHEVIIDEVIVEPVAETVIEPILEVVAEEEKEDVIIEDFFYKIFFVEWKIKQFNVNL